VLTAPDSTSLTAPSDNRGVSGVEGQSVYYPFGGECVITNSVDNRYKFTGLERDSETGLDHTLNRQYSSTLGRWLSPDPVRGCVMNPQKFDRYSYVGDNPTTRTDPNGDQFCDDTFHPFCRLGLNCDFLCLKLCHTSCALLLFDCLSVCKALPPPLNLECFAECLGAAAICFAGCDVVCCELDFGPSPADPVLLAPLRPPGVGIVRAFRPSPAGRALPVPLGLPASTALGGREFPISAPSRLSLRTKPDTSIRNRPAFPSVAFGIERVQAVGRAGESPLD
jgi:RHS repeat-associated protein